jgi:hypothetical protein
MGTQCRTCSPASRSTANTGNRLLTSLKERKMNKRSVGGALRTAIALIRPSRGNAGAATTQFLSNGPNTFPAILPAYALPREARTSGHSAPTSADTRCPSLEVDSALGPSPRRSEPAGPAGLRITLERVLVRSEYIGSVGIHERYRPRTPRQADHRDHAPSSAQARLAPLPDCPDRDTRARRFRPAVGGARATHRWTR